MKQNDLLVGCQPVSELPQDVKACSPTIRLTRPLPQAPSPAGPVMRTFDYELLAKIVAANKLKREKRQAAGSLEPYRRPEPNYLFFLAS